jgi:hypothetical protein
MIGSKERCVAAYRDRWLKRATGEYSRYRDDWLKREMRGCVPKWVAKREMGGYVKELDTLGSHPAISKISQQLGVRRSCP